MATLGAYGRASDFSYFLIVVTNRSGGSSGGNRCVVDIELRFWPPRCDIAGKSLHSRLLVGLVVLAVWIAWVQQSKPKAIDFGGEGGSWDYVDQFWAKDPHNPELGPASIADLLARPVKNILLQGAHLSEILTRSPWLQPLWYSPVILGVVGLIAIGYAVSFRGDSDGITEWYFAAYVSIYLFWPFDVGPRFVFPVFPLALLYFWRGAGQLKLFAARCPMVFMGSALLLYGRFSRLFDGRRFSMAQSSELASQELGNFLGIV